MSNKMKISATYEDFPSVIEKVMVEIGTSVYQCIKVIEKETAVDGKIVIENLVEFKIVDERMGYNWTYIFDKKEMKQFINTMQRLQVQISDMGSSNDSGNTSGGCPPRPVWVK